MIYEIYRRLESIVDNEFADIVTNSEIIFAFSGIARKLRINVIDGTFIDIWYSVEDDYSFHWEQRGIRDAVYRHDNAPHRKWSAIKTFPKHCHNGNEENITESHLPDEPEKAVREYLKIVRERLLKLKVPST